MSILGQRGPYSSEVIKLEKYLLKAQRPVSSVFRAFLWVLHETVSPSVCFHPIAKEYYLKLPHSWIGRSDKNLSVFTSFSFVNLLGFCCIFYPGASFFWIRSHNLFRFSSLCRSQSMPLIILFIYFANSTISLEKLGNKTAFNM